eukprot:654648-Pelagomonas_calceolata.AAC.2
MSGLFTATSVAAETLVRPLCLAICVSLFNFTRPTYTNSVSSESVIAACVVFLFFPIQLDEGVVELMCQFAL